MSIANPADRPAIQALTLKEEIFVSRFLTHFNASRAAKEAGYATTENETSGNAHYKQIAYEILNKPYIKTRIDEFMSKLAMERNEALARLAAIARGDVTEFFSFVPSLDEDGNPVGGEWVFDMQKCIDSGHGFLIKSYDVSRFGSVHVELYSAADALDRICKHLNLYKADETVVNVSLTAWAQFVQKAKSAAPNSADDSIDDGEPITVTARSTPSAKAEINLLPADDTQDAESADIDQ